MGKYALKSLSKNEIKTLEQICSLSQTNVKKLMSRFLRTKYSSVFETKDFICAQGDIPIALVAHMDTVFKNLPEDFFYDSSKNVMWSPQGAGFDDRAGIYAIMKIVQSGFKPHIILTTDEEIGAIGASALIEYDIPFKDVRYLIQLDRRGANDCVFYDCDNDEFTNYIEKFGFVTAYGSFSDISVICPEWKIAGVNLSVGYMNEHTNTEVLYVGHLVNTIEKVKQMLSEKDIPSFEYREDPHAHDWEKYYRKWLAGTSGTWVQCHKCKEYFQEVEAIPAELSRGAITYFCPDCVINSVEWCADCGTAFVRQKGDYERIKCYTCEKEV